METILAVAGSRAAFPVFSPASLSLRLAEWRARSLVSCVNSLFLQSGKGFRCFLMEQSPRQLKINGARGYRAMTEALTDCKESAANNPGLCEKPDEVTKGYFVQQTMYRIKDPMVSLDFYTRILGMTLLRKLDFPEAKFSLYFLGYEDPAKAPKDPAERTAWTFKSKATLELTHNWGTESDPSFKGYHTGNTEPRGYGHIGITVDDTYKACERFEKLGVEFAKKPDDGRMKGLAFVKDPDGYWIEIFDVNRMSGLITTAAS